MAIVWCFGGNGDVEMRSSQQRLISVESVDVFCTLAVGFNELAMRAVKILIRSVLFSLLAVFIDWNLIFVRRMKDPKSFYAYLLWQCLV